jgi:hypothetical protein
MSIKLNEPPVQAALIIAVTTIVTVVLGLIFKDYFIPGWIESRSRKRKGEALLAQYRIQLFKAGDAFNSRLKEIYRIRSHYLWADAPKHEFYLYKYRSSVYRLCVLLGWIHAYRRHEALLSFGDPSCKYAINDSLKRITSALADGQEVEMYVAKAICEIVKIDLAALPPDALLKFSVQIDELVQKYTSDQPAVLIANLSKEDQNYFLEELVMRIPWFPASELSESQRQAIIKEVSVKLGLIYRDWQQALGDLMVERSEGGELSHEVIGYRQFEKMMTEPASSEERTWIAKAERLFEGLDLRAEHQTDSRILQLRRLYMQVYNLLEVLYNLDEKNRPVEPAWFRKIAKSV